MNRFAAIVTSAAVALGLLLVACVTLLPGRLAGGAALPLADRLRAENDVRATLLQGVAGLLALAGLALGASVTMRQVRVNREGQFIDLFTKAVEQLASEQVAVRHGGVYAMERIAEAAPHYRGHVAALLAAFVRQQAPWPPAHAEERPRWHGGLRDDVGGAMGVLGRRTMVLPGTGIELERTDLRGAELTGLDLSRFCFAGANLDGAMLTGCDLSDATFTGATLRNAVLTGATLTGADLTGADLTGADLDGVRGLPIAEPDL
jgi:pentapeptide repeat protein